MLTLSRTLANRLLKQAQSSPQNRVCGLLLGHAGEPSDIAPLRNRADNPALAHTIDAAEYSAAVAAAQEKQQDVIATYHSHPDSPPLPSPDDLAAQPAPGLPLLLISLNTKGVLEMRAFTSDGNQAIETPVQIFL